MVVVEQYRGEVARLTEWQKAVSDWRHDQVADQKVGIVDRLLNARRFSVVALQVDLRRDKLLRERDQAVVAYRLGEDRGDLRNGVADVA